ncbi:MAG: preprotein translocase subunit YajC [Bacteroidaceae bacterium]|nr:preprotein translocase subunit YajC [Bacteroidaceae bacterium]
MSKILSLNPYSGVIEIQESQEIMTFVQSQDVNLSEPVEGGAQSGGFGGGMMIWMILLLVMMMFMMRPRRDKEGEKFRNSLQREQEVVTSSGIFGKIKDIDDVSVTIEVAQNIKIKVDKRYVNPVPTAQPVAQPKKSKKEKKEDKA